MPAHALFVGSEFSLQKIWRNKKRKDKPFFLKKAYPQTDYQNQSFSLSGSTLCSPPVPYMGGGYCASLSPAISTGVQELIRPTIKLRTSNTIFTFIMRVF